MTAIRTALRLLATGSFGLTIPALVFFALDGFTGHANDREALPIEGREVNFTRLIVDTERADTPRVKPKPPGPTQPPPPGPTVPRGCSDCGGPGDSLPPVRLVLFTGPRTSGPSFAPSRWSGDPQPFVRVLPEYPPNGRGNGSVLVRFDISAIGTVLNARVIESMPRGMFDQAALRAIARWRYRPAVTEGQAVERRGVQVRLRFELEQA
jgi:protein TonB